MFAFSIEGWYTAVPVSLDLTFIRGLHLMGSSCYNCKVNEPQKVTRIDFEVLETLFILKFTKDFELLFSLSKSKILKHVPRARDDDDI